MPEPCPAKAENVYARHRRSGKIHLLNNFNRPRCRCSTSDVTESPNEWDVFTTTDEVARLNFDDLCGVCAKPQQQPAAMRKARNLDRFLDNLTNETRRGRKPRERSIYEY